MLKDMFNDIADLIKFYLDEDLGGADDITTAGIVDPFAKECKFTIVCKEPEQGGKIILCGIGFLEQVFECFNADLKINKMLKDGTEVKKGDIVFEGLAFNSNILRLERTILNITQHLSGIASKVAVLNDVVLGSQNPNIKLLDTRKTTPGFRSLQKYAVKIGGGQNHRFGLFDRPLIKENHIAAAGGIENVISILKQKPLQNCEIECQTPQELDAVLANHQLFTRVMLDNFSPQDVLTLAKKVKQLSGLETEVSGGINQTNLANYCLPCVDFISLGSLTHSVKSIDFSLDIHL